MPTSGGKGNRGMFIKRDPKICAAGIPSEQPDDNVSGCFQNYLMTAADEVEALIGDALIPPKPPSPLPPLRRPKPPDMRNAFFTEVSQLINPPIKNKYVVLAEDMKETAYASYWKQQVGKTIDPTPMLPAGFDIEGTTFGKRTKPSERLYDVIMPKVPLPDTEPLTKYATNQKQRNYCRPAFDPEHTFGQKTGTDYTSSNMRCYLINDKMLDGSRDLDSIILADHRALNEPGLRERLNATGNLKIPKERHLKKLSFNGVPETLRNCDVNPEKEHITRCLGQLNTLRKKISTLHSGTFYTNFYLGLKFLDKEKTGWLPKNIVYQCCNSKSISLNPTLIEPLLSLWGIFDGKLIEYKMFVDVINCRIPIPDLPKLQDLPDDCKYYRTTYSEMVKPNQSPDCRPRAGKPTGKCLYLDHPKCFELCFRHELIDFPEAKACIYPSLMSWYQVDQEYMYEKRDPEVVRRVFENIGDTFTDAKFEEVWNEAKTMHSQGWVCFETFRHALENWESNAN